MSPPEAAGMLPYFCSPNGDDTYDDERRHDDDVQMTDADAVGRGEEGEANEVPRHPRNLFLHRPAPAAVENVGGRGSRSGNPTPLARRPPATSGEVSHSSSASAQMRPDHPPLLPVPPPLIAFPSPPSALLTASGSSSPLFGGAAPAGAPCAEQVMRDVPPDVIEDHRVGPYRRWGAARNGGDGTDGGKVGNGTGSGTGTGTGTGGSFLVPRPKRRQRRIRSRRRGGDVVGDELFGRDSRAARSEGEEEESRDPQCNGVGDCGGFGDMMQPDTPDDVDKNGHDNSSDVDLSFGGRISFPLLSPPDDNEEDGRQIIREPIVAGNPPPSNTDDPSTGRGSLHLDPRPVASQFHQPSIAGGGSSTETPSSFLDAFATTGGRECQQHRRRSSVEEVSAAVLAAARVLREGIGPDTANATSASDLPAAPDGGAPVSSPGGGGDGVGTGGAYPSPPPPPAPLPRQLRLQMRRATGGAHPPAPTPPSLTSPRPIMMPSRPPPHMHERSISDLSEGHFRTPVSAGVAARGYDDLSSRRD